MDEDEIVGPDGLPLVEAEMEVLREHHDAYVEKTGESISLEAYAVEHFFSAPASPYDGDDNGNIDAFAAPAAAQGGDDKSTLERVNVHSLPTLERVGGGALPTLERVEGKPLPALERLPKTGSAAAPLPLERVAPRRRVADMPALRRISTQASAAESPSLGIAPNSIPRRSALAEKKPMPPLRLISGAKKPMPALRRIGAASAAAITTKNPYESMPALRRIGAASAAAITTKNPYESMPGLEDTVSLDHVVATLIGEAAATGARDVYGRTGAAAASPNPYAKMWDDDLNTFGTKDRAALLHHFDVVRAFATDSEEFAADVSGQDSLLVGLACELRSVMAAVDASDADDAICECNLLDSERMALVAASSHMDTDRASFVTSAEALADLISSHQDTSELRAIIARSTSGTRGAAASAPIGIGISIKRPDALVSNVGEAWVRFLTAAYKDMGNNPTPTTAVSVMLGRFKKIASEVTRISRKVHPRRERYFRVWATMGEALLHGPITMLENRAADIPQDIALPWLDELWHAFGQIAGVSATSSNSTIGKDIHGKSLLLSPSISGKVQRSLDNVTNWSVKAVDADTAVREAKSATQVIIAKFLERRTATDPTPREKDFVGLFLTAYAGIIFVREVDAHTADPDLLPLRDQFITNPMRDLFATLESARGEAGTNQPTPV